ncbi:hypothetical protein S7711_04751 [Stachybotrys chartarum IBT 7711]|uniref:Man(5)GlcNAc(2)-PP-dolichol translocation protein RFT1 n=1 Tax=Stachybotrys chartarum (strain CBS 109288 / IBT 7711) TaxID=1280523 RepID=A0A084ASD7_STACB|nr:hypothetical protein S7711_04751 [Stachybotrys chartarum IBT 7711]
MARPPDPKPAAAAAPANMIHGASLLISLQLLSRLVTFVANQLLLRFLTAPLLGLATQLEVYYLSVLFFARESLRVAVQRHASSSAQAVVNLAYLPIALGAVVSVVFGAMYLAGVTKETLETPNLVLSLYLYGGAALVELLSEPCFVLMQTRLQFGTRAAAESTATFLRCIVVFGTALWAAQTSRELGVLPFALGQLCYGGALLLVYLAYAYRLAATDGFSLFPRPVTGKDESRFLWSYFDRPTISLATSMMAQGVVKHILTQGDTFLISLLASPQVQGVYALANNYGGLIARLLFQPIEESSRSYFSRLLSEPAAREPVSTTSSKDKSTLQPSPAVQQAKTNLSMLLRIYILFSTAVASIGPFAAPILLSFVAGRRWTGSGAGEVLGVYCFYIPFLTLNGVTESFVASVASEAEVHRQSGWMSAFSVAFAASAYLFMRVFPLGAIGLVFANIVNMLCRIVWSASFIKVFFKRHGADFGVAELLPGGTLAVAAASIGVMYQLDITEHSKEEPIKTLVKIAVSAIPLLIHMAIFERKFLLECFQAIRGRRAGKRQ